MLYSVKFKKSVWGDRGKARRKLRSLGWMDIRLGKDSETFWEYKISPAEYYENAKQKPATEEDDNIVALWRTVYLDKDRSILLVIKIHLQV